MIPRTDQPRPWRHQAQATDWARERHASYFDMDMGVGKSRAFIDYADGIEAGLTLVTSTKRGKTHVWPGQYEEWSGRPMRIIEMTKGTVAKRIERAATELRDAGQRRIIEGAARKDAQPCVVVCNWNMYLSKAFEGWMRHYRWDLLCGDEMHKVKAHTGKATTSKAVARAWGHQPQAKRVALSGTPLPHDPLDAWAQYRALAPGTFHPRFAVFRARIAVMGGYVNPKTGRPCDVIAWQNMDWFRATLARTMFQPAPEDVELNLPPTRHLRVVVDLEPKGRGIYKTVETDVAARVARGEINPSNGLVKLLRLQQLASGIASSEEIDDYGGVVKHCEIVDTAKQEAVAEIIGGTTGRVVVFCVFHPELDAIHKAAAQVAGKGGGVISAELSGRRDELLEWKSDAPGSPRVLAVQIASGAETLDFTMAHHCAFMSTGFNMGLYLQALKRCDRAGQTHPVTFYHILARGTVDHRCYGTLERRGNLVKSALAGLRELAPV